VDDLEKLQSLRLEPEARTELLETQTECTFIFASEGAGGWSSGVVVSFLHHDGVYWITAAADRRHVTSLAKDPRVSIVVTNLGTALPGRQMLSVRGIAIVHRDAATREWFLPRFAARLGAADPAAFMRLLDSPNRVVIEVRPTAVAVSHDSRKLPGDGRGGPASAETDPV
jgi:general stress protein 26